LAQGLLNLNRMLSRRWRVMKQALGILTPLLFAAGGCMSGPIPQELAEGYPASIPEPLSVTEVVRLSRAGISDDLIVGLVKTRGLAGRPDLWGTVALRKVGVTDPVMLVLLASPQNPTPRQPAPQMVYREFTIPLWPSYSRGRWHLGLRMTCMVRASEEPPKSLSERPELNEPFPEVIDP
jgi:hypothetical protein